mmetsp:Transcript_47954/g.95406  ORF Transcript_47954/g.95406 Transcript_47954/m.95406 type:complete len:86 (+) Transcript_47954:371-628(+)
MYMLTSANAIKARVYDTCCSHALYLTFLLVTLLVSVSVTFVLMVRRLGRCACRGTNPHALHELVCTQSMHEGLTSKPLPPTSAEP